MVSSGATVKWIPRHKESLNLSLRSESGLWKDKEEEEDEMDVDETSSNDANMATSE